MLWHSPWAFLLIIPLILGMLYLIFLGRKKRPAIQFSSINVFRKVSPSIRSRLVWVPTVFKFIALALAITALARPQRADVQIQQNVEGIDILFVLDISHSMIVEDMQPENRLEASKVILEQFVNGRQFDRIGLTVFSGEAFTRIPLTTDYPLLIESIRDIEISYNIEMGTAIGVALAHAVARVRDSTAKSKVIIFATDGENNTGTIDPLTALEIAKGYGVKIYSIGVGKDGETQLPVFTTDAFGNRIKRYQPFYSAVNDDLLQKMADETGGIYYKAEDTPSLERIFNEIDRLERTQYQVNEFTNYAELFPPYLTWALWIYLLGSCLGMSILRRLP